ncbi:hypothetical protein HDV05_007080, partial [Chytridiales sp. JEL 0842]
MSQRQTSARRPTREKGKGKESVQKGVAMEEEGYEEEYQGMELALRESASMTEERRMGLQESSGSRPLLSRRAGQPATSATSASFSITTAPPPTVPSTTQVSSAAAPPQLPLQPIAAPSEQPPPPSKWCPCDGTKVKHLRGNAKRNLQFPSRTIPAMPGSQPYFEVDVPSEPPSQTPPPIRYSDLGRTFLDIEFPDEPSQGSTLYLSGWTGASGSMASPGKDQEAADIEEENLRMWAEDTKAMDDTAEFLDFKDIQDKFEAAFAAEAEALEGSTELYTIVTSLKAYIKESRFQRYIVERVVPDFTRLSAYASLFVNHVVLSPSPKTNSRPSMIPLLAPLRASAEFIRNSPGFVSVECKDYSNPINMHSTAMATNFHNATWMNFYGRVQSFFRMGIASLPEYMRNERGPLPDDVDAESLETDAVCGAEEDDMEDMDVEEAIVEGFVNRGVDDDEIAMGEDGGEVGDAVVDDDDDDEEEEEEEVNNPYGMKLNRLANILTNAFYFGNDYLIDTFAEGHPRKVRRMLTNIVQRSDNRVFTPTRQTVDAVQQMARGL